MAWILIKRRLPVYLMGLAAGIILADYYIKIPELGTISSTLITWALIISSFAVILGWVSLVRFHYLNIKKREPGTWYLSIYGVILMIITFIIGLTLKTTSPEYSFIWFYLSEWLYLTSLAICGFYMVSAGYRAFRVRTTEALVLFVTAALVLIGTAPVITGPMVDVANWISTIPNTGASRAVEIGSGIGVVVLGLRLLLGKEKTIVTPTAGAGGGQ